MTEYLLRGVIALVLIGPLVWVAYVEIFKIPHKRERKTAALLARATAQREGVEKICDAGERLRKLIKREVPLHPEDPEIQDVLWMLAEGEKQFKENSDPPMEEK